MTKAREWLATRTRTAASPAKASGSAMAGGRAAATDDTGQRDVLRVTGVSLSFGGVRALDDVAFTVETPGVVGLIGANGAGKSTLLNCIAGRFRPQAGHIEFYGQDILTIPKHQILLGRHSAHISEPGPI